MSQFIKMSDGGRVYAPIIAKIVAGNNRVIISDRNGNLLASPQFDNAEEARAELQLLTEQFDQWEASEEKARQEASHQRNRR